MTRLLALANAAAGSARDDSVDAAVEVLRTGAEVELVSTSGADELDDVLAGHPDVDLVVALGGDGSLHMIVGALRRTGRLADVEVGLVPLGTGNDFARSVGLPGDAPAAAARVVLDGRTRKLDLGVTADDEVVVNAIHVGVGAEAAAAATPFKQRLGPIGYAAGAVTAGFLVPGSRLSVLVDGEEVGGDHHVIQVAAGIGGYVGGGAPLLPEAEPDDGLFDVAVSFAAPWHRRLTYAWNLRSGTHAKRKDVTYLRGREVVIRGKELRTTNDGELREKVAEHHWRVEPAAWRLRVP